MNKVIDFNDKKSKKQSTAKNNALLLDELELTELKVARSFMKLEHNEGNWVFNKTRKKWMYFDPRENIWVDDTEGKLINDIAEYIEQLPMMYNDIRNDLDDKEWNKVARAIEKFQTAQGLNGIARCCKVEVKVISENSLDADPHLINCKNGFYSLNSHSFYPTSEESRSMFFTKHCNVYFEYGAKCPLWEKTVNEIFQHDQEYIDYVQRVFGYALYGEDKEHAVFIIEGETRTGKSTIFNPIIKIFGDYYKAVPEDAFTTKGKDTNLVLAESYGKRLLHIAETEKGAKLVLSLLKRISGGSPISGRRHHEQFFSYIAGFNIFMETNHAPEIGDDEATWARIHNIKFERYFEPHERDLDLTEKLEDELAGILNWLIEGWRKYQESRLTKPIKALDDTQAHRKENDYIQLFLDDCFNLTTDEDDFITGQQLFDVYYEWAERNKIEKKDRLDGIKFGQAIKKKKGIIYKNKRIMIKGEKVNRKVYVGMELITERRG